MKVFTYLCLLISSTLMAQTKIVSTKSSKPKLIVGIVVDQMRQDYIYRYWDKYGNGGFKKIIQEGYFYKNAHFNYVPTYTGPGHASIYSGTTPSVHGIIANDWFDKSTGKVMYCTDDKNVKPVGSESKYGYMSPKNLLVTTIGDELKLNSNQASKVFAVSLKDRSSILPGGHSANGAFWFDGNAGKFISSTHYVSELPKWLVDFNSKELAKNYLSKGWNTILPVVDYTESFSDDNKYEKSANPKEQSVFPYSYAKYIEANNFEVIKVTPYGNSITKDLAIECIKSEQLGKHKATDMLCISFSSTDYVGHAYGPRSIEVEDVYIRLDKDIEELINYLNTNVGVGNYVVFLTADHGACDIPAHLVDLKIPGGYVNEPELKQLIKANCQKWFGDSLVLAMENQQVFLNEVKINDLKLSKKEIEYRIADYLLTIKGISEAYPSDILKYEQFEGGSFKSLIQNGYNHVRSGNVAFSYNPAWMEIQNRATSHGASYSYDTHVPVLFYGAGIPKGSSVKKINITDIAPTISLMFGISFPNGTTGKVLEELFVK